MVKICPFMSTPENKQSCSKRCMFYSKDYQPVCKILGMLGDVELCEASIQRIEENISLCLSCLVSIEKESEKQPSHFL